MKYVIVKIGGSQYRVAPGDVLDVEKIEGDKGDKLKFDEVYLLVDGDQREVGQPLVKNVIVEAEIDGQFKGKKIRVATYKAKSRYRRTIGHRKLLTKIKISGIKKIAKGQRKPAVSSKRKASASRTGKKKQ